MEGGYQIIDLKNIPIIGSSVVIPGLYELIANTRKPLLIQNVVIVDSGVETKYRDFFASPRVNGNDFWINDFGQNISVYVEPDDTVYGYTVAYLEATSVPINSTLEVDGAGKIGVKANS